MLNLPDYAWADIEQELRERCAPEYPEYDDEIVMPDRYHLTFLVERIIEIVEREKARQAGAAMVASSSIALSKGEQS